METSYSKIVGMLRTVSRSNVAKDSVPDESEVRYSDVVKC